MTWRTLCTILHSLMLHARVSESCIHFFFMYTANFIFPPLLIKYLLPIKCLINEDSDTTTPFKLATGIKPSILNLRVLFCPCVVKNLLHMLVHRC